MTASLASPKGSWESLLDSNNVAGEPTESGGVALRLGVGNDQVVLLAVSDLSLADSSHSCELQFESGMEMGCGRCKS